MSTLTFQADSRSFIVMREPGKLPQLIPAKYVGNAYETHRIGDDLVECMYNLFEATIDGRKITARRLVKAHPKVQSSDDAAVCDRAYRDWRAAENVRLASERNQEMTLLREALVSGRPMDFLRSRRSVEFNKLSGNPKTSEGLVTAFLEFVGLTSPTARHLRAWDAEVARQVRERLAEIVPGVREERRLAWMSTQGV